MPLVALSLLVTLALVGATAFGQVRKCEVDGEVVFTDVACPDRSRGVDVKVDSTYIGNLDDAHRIRGEYEALQAREAQEQTLQEAQERRERAREVWIRSKQADRLPRERIIRRRAIANGQ